jgi:Zn-dependent M28 family amino/carboxypeptidase
VSPQNDERTIEASNFIVIFEGEAKKSEDEPLIILANYDTEETETNAVDDNGSGVVTLVALGHYLAHQISSGKMTLNKTVILAATDMAIYKYVTSIDKKVRKLLII